MASPQYSPSDLYNALLPLFTAYSPPFVSKMSKPGKYDLWTTKTVEIAGRKLPEVYFAALIQQKGYVGFYYMPIYGRPEVIKPLLGAELLKLLKGKSCFHVKKMTPALKEQIAAALVIGKESYEKLGWL
jgi:hypothetical protein